MANDRKPGFLGKERFPEDEGEIKNQGDPMVKAAGGDKAAGGTDDTNEGEGNKSADRHYREGVRKTVESGKVDQGAKAAERAYEGAEGEELRRAEQEGKKHSHGEDPALRERKSH
jgi:hypothetical protein